MAYFHIYIHTKQDLLGYARRIARLLVVRRYMIDYIASLRIMKSLRNPLGTLI